MNDAKSRIADLEAQVKTSADRVDELEIANKALAKDNADLREAYDALKATKEKETQESASKIAELEKQVQVAFAGLDEKVANLVTEKISALGHDPVATKSDPPVAKVEKSPTEMNRHEAATALASELFQRTR